MGCAEDADHRDAAVWKAANPGYDDLIDPEDFESSVRRTPENEFRTKRLNQFVSSSRAWLPAGAWEGCVDGSRTIPDGSDVVLGFDGSYNNDSTALVVVTVAEEGKLPHVDVVEAWEKPPDGLIDWTVPILSVEDAIRAACRRWQVREIACDPARWARTYQVLDEEGLPVVDVPNSRNAWSQPHSGSTRQWSTDSSPTRETHGWPVTWPTLPPRPTVVAHASPNRPETPTGRSTSRWRPSWPSIDRRR